MEPGASPIAPAHPRHDQLSEEQADQVYARLQTQVGEEARGARTMADAAAVADHVAILKRHRPRAYDILASATADGSDLHEHGFATEDGFVGTENALVLCEYHDDLTAWPCAVVRRLEDTLAGRRTISA